MTDQEAADLEAYIGTLLAEARQLSQQGRDADAEALYDQIRQAEAGLAGVEDVV